MYKIMNKMQIVFSSGFDTYSYKKDKRLFNKKFVGELQLLSILERELGLRGKYKSIKEREIEYLDILNDYHKNQNSFIFESFKKDPIGISKELLRWRDQLKLANWDFEKGISERLDLISEIESSKLSKGTTDRLHQVFRKLTTVERINIEEIEVVEDLELCHPFYKSLFKLLKTNGIKIIQKGKEYSKLNNNNLLKVKDAILNGTKDILLDTNDSSFQILRFKDNIIASDFLADQLKNRPDFKPLIINNENTDLDASFNMFGLAISGSKINNANPQIIQLFKLIPSLLFKKVDPYNLLSLLNLPLLPFPKKLANQLREILISTNGVMNKEWNISIEDFKTWIENDSKKNFKETSNKIDLYLHRERTELVASDEIINIYRDISKWAKKMMVLESKSDNIKHQLNDLRVMSISLVRSLDAIGQDRFTAKDLNKHINKIYEPLSIKVHSKEKDSYFVLNSPNQLYDCADILIWFDFHTTNLAANFYDFLYFSEENKLKANPDILIWDKEKQVQFQLDQLQKAIFNTNDGLYLFVPEKAKGQDTTSHPLLANLAASIKNIKEFYISFNLQNNESIELGWASTRTKKIEHIDLPEAKDYIEIKEPGFLKQRVTESYSSINDLIQYPLDWVMHYQAKISDKGLSDIGELITIKGNLSHFIIQILFDQNKEGTIDLNSINNEKKIDELLKEYVPQHASPFCLEENTFEFKSFTKQLKESFKVLLEIIEENDLEYHSSEYSAKGKIDKIDFGGKIDLLFYKEKTPIIIDLKWTYSTKKYFQLLEEEKAIQLAIYSKLLKKKNSITAYFLISAGKLLSTSNYIKGDNVEKITVVHPEFTNDRIIKKTINSFNYRWDELQNGTIESGEDLDIESLNYYQDTERKDLIPLEKANKIKKVNPYSSNGLFKGFVK